MSPSRRRVIRAGGGSVAAVLAGGLAGCGSVLPTDWFGGDADATDSPLSKVPAGAVAVSHIDVARTLEDAAADRIVGAALAPLLAGQPDSSVDTEAAPKGAELLSAGTGLDPSAAETAVGFALNREGSPPAVGSWIRATWPQEAVFARVDDRYPTVEYAETTANGRPQYVPAEDGYPSVGVPESNAYVVGTDGAVRETIAVIEGDADALGSTLRSAYRSVRPGVVRFAVAVPDDLMVDRVIRIGPASIPAHRLTAVEHVSGAWYRDGDTVGVVFRIVAGSGEDAEDLEHSMVGTRAILEGTVGEPDIEAALSGVSIDRDEATITVEATAAPDRAAAVVEWFVEGLAGAHRGEDG